LLDDPALYKRMTGEANESDTLITSTMKPPGEWYQILGLPSSVVHKVRALVNPEVMHEGERFISGYQIVHVLNAIGHVDLSNKAIAMLNGKRR
jgi:hypothetical protein